MFFYIKTLGCARNGVDSDVMEAYLLKYGHYKINDSALAVVIIVNTCSFTNLAANESINCVLKLLRYKKIGFCEKLIVVGCLAERFKKEIVKILPEVDWFLGTGSFDKIVSIINNGSKNKGSIFFNPNRKIFIDSSFCNYKYKKKNKTFISYLKISEGCEHYCSYCIIPKLRGKQKSRFMSNIIDNASNLVKLGVKEIILIAQDTSNYGKDLSENQKLDLLLKNLADLFDKVWIRFLYSNPGGVTHSLINTVRLYRNICSYFDIPIQHVSYNIIKKMRRSYKSHDLVLLFRNIRESLINVVLRTTFMVGFPGETDYDFASLVEFNDIVRFDHLGVFTYSDSDDLSAHLLSGHIDEELSLFRQDVLMSRQCEISGTILNMTIGRTLSVIIELVICYNFYEGRSMGQAPEVDGVTYVRTVYGSNLVIGNVVYINVVEGLEYDLVGELYE